jgi:hypothetical protein
MMGLACPEIKASRAAKCDNVLHVSSEIVAEALTVAVVHAIGALQ